MQQSALIVRTGTARCRLDIRALLWGLETMRQANDITQPTSAMSPVASSDRVGNSEGRATNDDGAEWVMEQSLLTLGPRRRLAHC